MSIQTHFRGSRTQPSVAPLPYYPLVYKRTQSPFHRLPSTPAAPKVGIRKLLHHRQRRLDVVTVKLVLPCDLAIKYALAAIEVAVGAILRSFPAPMSIGEVALVRCS